MTPSSSSATASLRRAAAPRSASEASQESSPHTPCEEPPPSTRPRAAWTGLACLEKPRLSGLATPNASTPPAPKPAPGRTNRRPPLSPLRPTHAPPNRRQNQSPILGLPRLPQLQRHPRYRSLGPTAHYLSSHFTRAKGPTRQTHPHLRGTFFTPRTDPPEKTTSSEIRLST